MPDIKEITRFLDDYLRTGDIDDTSWNGLQLEGKEEVGKVAFAVDAGVETFEKAVDEKADMLIVHHGLFWTNRNPSISGWMLDRVKILFENGISLYCSHLPLDRHEEVGHNAQILSSSGQRSRTSSCPSAGRTWDGRAGSRTPARSPRSKRS
ncbi:MAG: Nif3-like dinuclear metal center hexameric protein [Thermodesulfobacteriota bacterium]